MEIQQYLTTLQSQLFDKNNWQQIILNRSWTSQIPRKAGVYVFKENDNIVYVGETGNLQGRMNDLLDSRHHQIRRTLGSKLFSTYEGFQKATSMNKFPPNIEVLLNNHIATNLSVAYLEVSLGRKELEELIQQDIHIDIRLNKRGKRISN